MLDLVYHKHNPLSHNCCRLYHFLKNIQDYNLRKIVTRTYYFYSAVTMIKL